MGVFTQTNATITCEDQEQAEKVLAVLEKMRDQSDENQNFGMEDLRLDCGEKYNGVVFFLYSGRSQNLEWQCEQILEKIKPLGILQFDAPFMYEGEGIFYDKDDNDCPCDDCEKTDCEDQCEEGE